MQKVIDKIEDKYGNKIINDMKEYYNDSMKDPAFKQLITKLKLSDNVLMEYTSLLKESAIEYNNCAKCKGIMECQNALLGYAYLPRIANGKLLFENKICRYNKEIKDKRSYLKNVFTYDINEENMEASFDSIYMVDKKRFPVIEWVHNFHKNYKRNKQSKGLFLNGNFGSGKTYLISALFNELARDGVKSAIIFWPEFLRELKASFSTDFKFKYDYIKKVPLLLIDDIGAESVTEWNRDEILCSLIQYRMQEHLPTFFTSNFDMEGLERHFAVTKNGDDVIKARRIMERIKQLTDNLELVGKNYRK